MTPLLNRRSFFRQSSALLAATQAGSFGRLALGAETTDAIAETSYGKVRGAVSGDIKIFKGIPYGGNTGGQNRFMPPVKPGAWTGVRDALAYGPTAPQTVGERRGAAAARPAESEDCLVLNVFTPSLSGGAKRPVMVWLHGGGFSTGSGSGPILDGTNLAHSGDVVVVSLNHRLNVLGFTYLGEQAGSDFALSGGVGLLDLVAALEWVRDNIAHFGGDPNLVTIFGQSGGGRKVATLMSMPSAQGLFHRAIIESGAVLRLMTREDAIHYSELLLAELGLRGDQARELQSVPLDRLLAANAAALKKTDQTAPGYTPNTPMVDGKAIPAHPWDPAGPALSAKIPLLMGWARTEETLYDRPTPETLALDEAGLKARAAKRLGMDPSRVIETYRKAHPDASPWDLYILIATDHPRGIYARELAKRKAAQAAAPAYLYRFDWETPEGGGHMRSPHTIEIPFVFHNVAIAGPLISKMPEAYALAEKTSAAWVAFARTGDPNTPGAPRWPAYSAGSRDTMLFNNTLRVEQDPDRAPRLAMEQVLKLS
ncbi:MAG TPA: carboxylesterase family protein [Bryobacteraceae bacterium]|nr:carboxylesterase family protein [Bryobacteraceae bacterium]